jgi:hypothetical protein
MTQRSVNALKQHIRGREFDIAKELFGMTDGDNRKEHNQPCPVCREGTNRFWFSPERRTFHCRKCGFGGDIIRLAEKVFDLTFREAFDKIANAAGYVDGATHISHVVNEIKKAVQEGKPILPTLDTWRLDAESPIYKATAAHRPDITFDDYQRAGAKLFREGIAIPMFDNDSVLSGYVRYFQSGGKPKLIGKSGIVGVDAIYNLRIAKPAKVVFKTAGVSDYLVLSGVIDRLVAVSLASDDRHHNLTDDFYAFTNGAGENEKPDKFESLLRPALEGKTVIVIQDNDEAGEAGALRWAESIAEYAADVRIVRLHRRVRNRRSRRFRKRRLP